ncbi:DUF3360 family protein [Pseudoalteromonas gelatinilytica]
MNTRQQSASTTPAEQGSDTHTDQQSYQALHKPSSEFSSRDEYLEHELQIMQPKRWRPNLPFRDYRFELEDSIPAMAGTIGKVVMVGAIAATFAAPLGLGEGFILENVRYELLIVSIFHFIIFRLLFTNSKLSGYAWPAYSFDPYCGCCGWSPNGLRFTDRGVWAVTGT